MILSFNFRVMYCIQCLVAKLNDTMSYLMLATSWPKKQLYCIEVYEELCDKIYVAHLVNACNYITIQYLH